MHHNLYDQPVTHGCLKDLIHRSMLFGLEVNLVEHFAGPSHHQKKPVQLGDQDQQTAQVTLEGDMYRYLTQGEARIHGIPPVQEGEHQHPRDEEGADHQETHGNVVPRVLHLQLQNKEHRPQVNGNTVLQFHKYNSYMGINFLWI